MRFIDATVFINWISASRKALNIEEAASGYILYKVNRGEYALTTTLVKDEVLIWLSRYRASQMDKFIKSLRALSCLKIVTPNMEDEEEAVKEYGKYPLGFSDLVTLSVMKRNNIGVVYSADKGFDKVPWVKRIFTEVTEEPEFNQFLKMLERRGITVK
ncbi:MAG: hypothetical protein DRN81_01575 [Thermoproteota archaeon]|nr:MAG: hypothetical protein DRN81_01575 [Candidatus Korarchaeota archaeon]